MTPKSISHCQGKGSLSHNNRTFKPKNVDTNRSDQNITFIKQSIKEAYEICFADAVERYNEKQKRSDRKIKTSYFENTFDRAPCDHVFISPDKRKSFYEDLVQIGTKDDTGCGSEDAEIAAECLTEYMNGFAERNPNMYVFNAVLHKDETTPHLHIDYIPIGHYNRGVDTQNGLAQALKEQGYTGIDAISKWRENERKVLEKICKNHNINISAPQKSRGYSFAVDEYKEYKDKINELQSELAPLRQLKEYVDKAEFAHKKVQLAEKYIVSSEDIDKLQEQIKSVALQKSEQDLISFQLTNKEHELNDFEQNLSAQQQQQNILQDEIDMKLNRANYLLESAEKKYQQQLELNRICDEKEQKISDLHKQNSVLDYELDKLKNHFHLEYSDSTEMIIDRYDTLKNDYDTADKLLNAELKLRYLDTINLSLADKINMHISNYNNELTRKDIIIEEKNRVIDNLHKLTDDISAKLLDMQNCLVKVVKAVGAIAFGESSFRIELPEKIENLITAIGDYTADKLRKQNTLDLADDIENHVWVDKEIRELLHENSIGYNDTVR